MITEQTLERIRWHAGFSERNEPDDHSIAWRTAQQTDSDKKLYEAGLDMIDALSILNHELNGPIPSESALDKERSTLPKALVYYIAEIQRMLRDSQSSVYNYAATAETVEWMISTAWLAVLAGDIDDITEEIRLAGMSRSFGSEHYLC